VALKRSTIAPRYAAVDLGAESGRVAVGCYDGECLQFVTVHRFKNVPVKLADGLHWDVSGLFREVCAGLRKAGRVAGVGVDAWGCDYALIDHDGRMIAPPFHHRNPRTASVVDSAFALVSQRELYNCTGIQHLRFNTVFQLLADLEAGLDLGRAERIALIPDLMAYWLTGRLVNEATVASTTGLADGRGRVWARGLIERLGIPLAPFTHQLTEPGSAIGSVSKYGLDPAPLLRTVAAHDTASAFVAAPLVSANAGVISCGTWSLVGLELEEPQIGEESAALNLSNEWGVDGTTRLLRNVMGLWLLQECRRTWARRGTVIEYAELPMMARAASAGGPLFDPDSSAFLELGDMPARIVAACRDTGQSPPVTPPEFVCSILLSLACKYRLVLEELSVVSGRTIEVVHIVGGGALNPFLCQAAADIIGVPVLAGPVEASAIGNILVQARAGGAFSSLEGMRAAVARSMPPAVYEPTGTPEVYDRFLAITGAGFATC
jgi:rhamnulokinase